MEGNYGKQKTKFKKHHGLGIDGVWDFSNSPKACLVQKAFPAAQALMQIFPRLEFTCVIENSCSVSLG